MVRAKLKLEFIENVKARMLRFRKRKEGLMKQLYELTTLCDVGACMIVYEPTQNQTSIWPEHDPDQVRRLIDAARSDSGKIKSCGVNDILEEKRRKVEKETNTIRLRNHQHSDQDCLNLMNETQLRELGSALRSKAEIVRSRIQFLKSKKMEEETIDNVSNSMLLDSDSEFDNLDQEIIDQLVQFYNLDQDIMPPTTDSGSQSYYAQPCSNSSTEGLDSFSPMAHNLEAVPPEPCFDHSSTEGLDSFSPMVQNLEAVPPLPYFDHSSTDGLDCFSPMVQNLEGVPPQPYFDHSSTEGLDYFSPMVQNLEAVPPQPYFVYSSTEGLDCFSPMVQNLEAVPAQPCFDYSSTEDLDCFSPMAQNLEAVRPQPCFDYSSMEGLDCFSRPMAQNLEAVPPQRCFVYSSMESLDYLSPMVQNLTTSN